MSEEKYSGRSLRLQRRNERLQKRKNQSLLTLGVAMLAVLVLVGLLYYIPRQIVSRETFVVESGEAVAGVPLHAIHEMTGSQFASIEFFPPNEPQPKLQATHEFYDLGSIGNQEVVEHQIAIKNIGDAPLTISRAYTTCGCTTAHIDATVLQPGEATLVTVTLDAGFHDVGGQTVRRGVIIESNDPNNPEFTFWMEASVRSAP
jgi:hypothetical protein